MRRDPEPRLELTVQWMTKAEEDLRLARHGLKMGTDCPFGLICFHAQQTAEKDIKALLTFHQIPFRKTHDLKELTRLLPKGMSLGVGGRNLAELSGYGVRPRYPYTGEPETRTSALRSLRQARRIRQSALRNLPDLSGGGTLRAEGRF